MSVKILENTIHCASLISARTGEPLVDIFLGKEKGQMSVDQARELAMNILAAAEGAETDVMLLRLGQEIGNPGAGVAMIRRMREFREERREALEQASRERS